MIRLIAYYGTQLSLAWAILLTGLVAAGNTWVLDRASGGFFVGETVPVPVRIVYAVMCLSMFAVAWLEWRYYSNTASSRQRRLGRLVILMFVLSTVMNAISQSAPERYNAIGAAIVVIGTAVLRRRPMPSVVDLRSRR